MVSGILQPGNGLKELLSCKYVQPFKKTDRMTPRAEWPLGQMPGGPLRVAQRPTGLLCEPEAEGAPATGPEAAAVDPEGEASRYRGLCSGLKI